MTAEIAILNSGAIALAADSAVTITTSKGQKIYNTVNKLFTLSKYRPVGVMVYGNANLMGIPWETIIKVYRRRLARKSFATLKEYAHDLIQFLDNKNPIFEPAVQEAYLRGLAAQIYTELRVAVDKRVRDEILKNGQIIDAAISRILSDTVSSWVSNWEKRKPLSHLPSDHGEQTTSRYLKTLEVVRTEIFKGHPLAPEVIDGLTRLVQILASCDLFNPAINSGIVVAGFGENELLPSVEAYSIEAIYNDRLKYRYEPPQSGSIDIRTSPSRIIPFAQVDEAITFIKSVSPAFLQILMEYFATVLEQYPKEVVNLVGIPEHEKRSLAKKLEAAGTRLLDDFGKRLNAHIAGTQVRPILAAVGVLPKEELAVMAEALVYLTSLRRRMSLDAETVGGPVDVAIISKGDGFVWIKRKHYFSKDLNPQFFANYNLEDAP